MIKKNSSGYVTEIHPLFTTDLTNYASFITAVRDGIKNDDLSKVLNINNLNAYLGKGDANDAADKVSTDSHDAEWAFGLVYDKTSSSITLATKFDAVTTTGGAKVDYISNVDKIQDIDIEADAKVLVYSYKQRSGKQLRVTDGVISSILTQNATKTAFIDGVYDSKTYTQSDKTLFDWNSDLVTKDEGAAYGKTSVALVKLVDGDATEVYVINPSTSK